MKRRDLDKAAQGGPHELIAALLDFEALPGRYPLTLREPRALFECSHEVLLLASGRPVDHLALGPLQAPGVQRAACFFVRMAMLRPGVDHYTLLGLEPGFKRETLREHYRMLMRLTHPDVPSSSSAWPSGSASRINLANDVLSSRVGKAEYDGWLANSARRLGPVNRLAAVLPCPTAPPRRSRWGWVLVAGGASMVALAFTLSPWPGLNASALAAALLADAEPAAPAPHTPELAVDADRPVAPLKSAAHPSPSALKAHAASPAARPGSGKPQRRAAKAQPAAASKGQNRREWTNDE